MLPLSSTKYPTTQRTVTGTTDVYADDVILNCDTSTGPVTINLGEIPNDFFSTQYKLYIVDSANNAATNNIIINAGAGQTINNQASFTVNINGSSTLLLITGNASYVALGNGVSTIPNFITVTYAQLTALVNANQIKPNADYLLLDAEFGSAPFLTPTNVYLKGMTINSTTSINTDAIFYDADYQAVGNYSSVTGFAGQLGIWTPVLITPLNSVVIWNNRHYKNISGVNGLVNPTTDVANWSVLPISTTNGYIQVINTIFYNYSNNRIIGREDLNGNIVERTIFGGFNSLNVFGWGNANIKQNQVLGNSIFNNCNNIYQNICFNNRLSNQSRVNFSQTNTTPTLENFVGNIFENSILNLPTGASQFNNNLIYSSTINFTGLGSDITNNNVIKNSTLNLTSQNEILSNNEIVGSVFNITVQNSGQIIDNIINNSTFSIEQNIGPSALISQNNLYQGSFMTIKDNSGTIQKNSLEKDCTFTLVTSNGFGARIQYLNLSNSSIFTITTNTSDIGIGFRGNGIIISNSSILTIEENTSSIGPISIINESSFIARKIEADVSRVNIANNSVFEIRDTGLSGTIITLSMNDGMSFGNSTFDMTQNILEATITGSSSNLKWFLDLSNPAIYDLGLQKLIIPSGLGVSLGKGILTNAAGITISKIEFLSSRVKATFVNDNGTTSFVSTSIASPPASLDIVSASGATTFNVVYRPSGQDSITIIKDNNFNIVTDAIIIT